MIQAWMQSLVMLVLDKEKIYDPFTFLKDQIRESSEDLMKHFHHHNGRLNVFIVSRDTILVCVYYISK